MDPHTKRVNGEYLYEYREHKDMEDPADFTNNQKELAQNNDISLFEVTQAQAKKAHYHKAGSKYGGQWLRNAESGVETPREATKTSGPGRSLDSFVNEEEDDIYEMY